MYISLTSRQINGISLSSSFLSLLRQSYDSIVYWIGQGGFLLTLSLSTLVLWPVTALVIILQKKMNSSEIELTADNLDRYWNLYVSLKNSLNDYNKVKDYNVKNVPFLLRGIIGSLKKMASLQIDIYNKVDKVFADLDGDVTDDFFVKTSLKEIMDDRPSSYKYVI